MAEEESGGQDAGKAEDEGLQDHISRWVEALDRWVKGIDLGMGRRDDDPPPGSGAGDSAPTPPSDGAGLEPAVGV